MSSIEWLEDRLNNVKPTEFCSIETIKGWIKRTKEMNRKEIINESCNQIEMFINWIDKEEIPREDGMWIRYYNGKDNYISTRDLFEQYYRQTFTDTNKQP